MKPARFDRVSAGFCAVLLGAAFCAPAAEPPKPMAPPTWRPYKELPNLIFYENFDAVKPYFNFYEHKPSGGTAAPEDKLAYQFTRANWGDRLMWASVDFTSTTLQAPMGWSPNQLYVQFSIWSDMSGEVNFRFFHANGEVGEKQKVPKAKTWTPIAFKMSDMIGKKLESDSRITSVEIDFTPKEGKGNPTAYIDDLFITLDVKSAELAPRILALEKSRLAMQRTAARDGFFFTADMRESLKAAQQPFKAKKKSKAVLVLASTPEETKRLADALTVSAQKKKLQFTYAPAADPVGAPLGGVSDMRTLLLYNLQKEPQLVLLCLGDGEGGDTRGAEALRPVLERALAMGTLPLVCTPIPANAADSTKSAATLKNLEAPCAKLGVPCIDAAFVPKDSKTAGLESLASVAGSALKHVLDSLAKE